jgi:hypothetical protein
MKITGSGKIKTLLLENRFFMKKGVFSKTAVILCVTWFIVLFKYTFAPSILDFMIGNLHIRWPIVFDWADAAALTSAASALYFSIHNVGNGGYGRQKDYRDENYRYDRYNRYGNEDYRADRYRDENDREGRSRRDRSGDLMSDDDLRNLNRRKGEEHD